MIHLEEFFDHELHGDDELNLPKNRRSLISLKKIKEYLDKGDSKLRDRRFAFGRENDVHALFGLEIEELEYHIDNPYQYDLTTLYNKSKNTPIIQAINKLNEAYKNDNRLTSINFSAGLNTGWDNDFDINNINQTKSYLLSRLQKAYNVNINDQVQIFDASPDEINDDLVNIDCYLNKDWNTDTKFRDTNHISINNLTLLANSFTSNSDLIYANRNRRFSDIINLWFDPSYAAVDKEHKMQLYFTSSGIRPDQKSYHTWNGFQVFDLDIKNSPTKDKDIIAIKTKLHEHLCSYNWYMGITLSSSKSGIHVYTKVSRPHHLFDAPTDNEELIKYWFRMNYLQKYSVLRYHLAEDIGLDLAINQKKAVIDFAMARLTQGIKVAHDDNALINPNFYDLPLIYTFHQGPDKPILDWLMHKTVTENRTFQAWTRLYSRVSVSSDPYLVFEAPKAISNDDIKVELVDDKIRPIEGELNYNIRWNMCNTLASVLGEDGRSWAHYVLRSDQCRNRREIDGIYNSAINNDREATKWGLQMLKKCGFGVTLSEEVSAILAENDQNEIISLIQSATTTKDTTVYNWKHILNSESYLSHLSNDLEKEFEAGKVNLIVSPPGTGKTEFVKHLSKQKRVLLVLPYVSVIDAKVVKDADLGDGFDVFMGNRTLTEMKKGRSAVMTIDKFGNMDLEKYGLLFDYIIIDESHLIFTSSYRIDAMSKALRKMKELIKNNDEFGISRSKLILMTGTPTGEIAYFSYYNSIKTFYVGKNNNRNKNVKFIVCEDADEQQFLISKHIADSIKNGIKVLYPTNQGDVQAVKLVGMIEHHLGKSLKWGYYKKANWNSELNININDHATVSDYDLILASNYLSVGIDIKDITQFECIYDDSFKAYEIEQFNCRLRKVDISTTIYVPMKMANGDVNEKLLNTQGWTLDMNRNDRDLLRDYMDIAKAKLKLAISYDPITNQIYTPGFRIENGNIVFDLEEHELTKFEERFIDVMQTPYFMAKYLTEYGYTVSVETAQDNNKTSIADVLGAGLEAAKFESEAINQTMVETMDWMFYNNTYKNIHGNFFNNFVSGIFGENAVKITEDKSLQVIKVEEDFLGMPLEVKVPNLRIFNETQPIAARFLSMYNPDTAWYLFNQCLSSSGKVVKAEVQRYMKLIQLVKSEENGKIGEEIYLLIRNIYDFIENKRVDEESWISTEEYEAIVDAYTQFYMDALNLPLRTDKMKAKIREEVAELFNILTNKKRKKKGIVLEFRLLPTPDNELRKKRKEFDSILLQIFQLGDIQLPEKLKQNIREKHLSENMISGLDAIKSNNFEISI